VLLPFPAGTDGVEFYTKEWSSASQSPKLAVTYTPPAPPLVSIVAADATAGEFGADRSLSFTISRGGATTSALDVPIILSGTATAGADFSGFVSPINLAVGDSSATLTLQVMSDAAPEGDETVSLSLGSGPSFLPAAPVSAAGFITDRPLHGWLNAELPVSAPRGLLDDADGDGEVNLIEYFKGTRPGDPASFRPLAMAVVTDRIARIRYPRAKDRPDVTAALRWSRDLLTWHASGDTRDGLTVTLSDAIVSPAGENPEMVEATAEVSGPDAGNTDSLFFQLEVTP
jgi:hypothetical protein